MREGNWETEVALALLAAFLFVAVALLASDKIHFAQVAHDVFFA